jgi:hypothetical protein
MVQVVRVHRGKNVTVRQQGHKTTKTTSASIQKMDDTLTYRTPRTVGSSEREVPVLTES